MVASSLAPAISMHRVLAIPELLDMIFSILDKTDNASNARVCKQWSEIALDALWRDTSDLYPLFNFLARLRETPRGDYEFLRKPDSSDWSRFEKYSHRVRRLAFVADDAKHILGESVFDDIARTRTSLKIFPKMHTLHWNASLPLCVMFMHANVKHFTITLPTDVISSSPHSFFQDVIARMPNLTCIDMRMGVPMRTIETDVVNLFPRLTKLQKVVISQFCATTRVMEALSGLQELNTVEFEYQDEHGDPADIQSFTPSLTEGGFPALHDLSLAVRFENAGQLMKMPFGPSSRLVDLYVDSPVIESPSTVHTFITIISETCPLIKSLSLIGLIDASIVPPLGTPPPADASFTFETLKPLLKCARLTRFSIIHQYQIELSQEDIEELASNWPALDTIMLNNEPAHLHQPTLTLQALLPFAKHCPNLETLGLFIHASPLDLPPAPADSPYVPFSGLRRLSLGLSSITDPHSVALCLSTVLPLCCHIETGFTWDDSVMLAMAREIRETMNERWLKWQSVEELVSVLIRLRMEEQDRTRELRKEVEDLRMRTEVLMGRAVVDGADVKRREEETGRDSCIVV